VLTRGPGMSAGEARACGAGERSVRAEQRLGRGVRWARRGGESWACVGKGLGWGLGRFGLVSGCWAVFFLFILFYF